MTTYHVVAVVVETDRAPETLTVAFENLAPVGAYIDEVYRLYADDVAVAIAIDGQPQNWHRKPDGSIIIDGPLA